MRAPPLSVRCLPEGDRADPDPGAVGFRARGLPPERREQERSCDEDAKGAEGTPVEVGGVTLVDILK